LLVSRASAKCVAEGRAGKGYRVEGLGILHVNHESVEPGVEVGADLIADSVWIADDDRAANAFVSVAARLGPEVNSALDRVAVDLGELDR